MFKAIKFKALRGREMPVFGILLLAVVPALLPITAQAQCSGIWDASGKWSFMQRNATRPVELTMSQNGKAIFGSATHIIPGSRGNIFSPGTFGESKTGKVDGTILGDRFSIEIAWNGGQIGVYNARILPSGRLEGEGYEKRSPNVRHAWSSTGALKCSPPPPVVPTPKPIGRTGKARTTTAPAAPPKPPFIIASGVVMPAPNHPFGIVPLSWDGGPDHPNVEVWLSMDNGAEIPAFSIEHVPQSPVWKQPKMGIPLQLQRYHHYKFVLKAAGKTLSTAAFVVP